MFILSKSRGNIIKPGSKSQVNPAIISAYAQMLTRDFQRVRMQFAGGSKCRQVWARSSMAEQWPFKPRVAGSIPVALIIYDEGWRRNLTGLFDAFMDNMLKFISCFKPVIGGQGYHGLAGRNRSMLGKGT
jgi:hypothetical protein